MDDLIPIEEIKKMVEIEKTNLTDDIVQNQYEKDKQSLSNDEKFKEVSKNIITKSAEVKMQGDMLALLNQKQKNDLAQYALECEKQKLDYRKKKEKAVVLADVKAEIANKKIETLWKRYGYLYKDRKDFIPSKSANMQKEIANWWNGTSDNFKKIVKGGIKILLWSGLIVLIGLVGYRIIMWIAKNTKNLPNIS